MAGNIPGISGHILQWESAKAGIVNNYTKLRLKRVLKKTVRLIARRVCQFEKAQDLKKVQLIVDFMD